MSDLRRTRQNERQANTAGMHEWRAFGRTLLGPALVVLGWQLITGSYLLGVLLVYLGFLVCLAECIWEPLLLNHRHYQVQIVFFALVVASATTFSIKVVFISAPLKFESYAMRKGEYPSGTVIAGIPWDSHLADLRVSITNPSDEDYLNVDLAVQPDKWSYKAAILPENSGCLLTSIGGNSVLIVPSAKGGPTTITMHRVGDGVEGSDNVGDVFQHFITEGGYRLRCEKFPKDGFTVQIVFALASIKPELRPHLFPHAKTSFEALELLPADKFDLLEAKPSPSLVAIHGNYNRGVKGFSISQSVQITDGN